MPSRGDVHPLTEHVAVALHDIAGVDADADMDVFGFGSLSVMGAQLALNLLGALPGMNTDGKSTTKASPMVLMTYP